MSKIFPLFTVTAFAVMAAVTACDSTSGNGPSNGRTVSDFETKNCDGDFNSRFPVSEALLFQEDGSYKIEIKSQKLHCYSKGAHSEWEWSGDSLNLYTINDGIPASCSVVCDLIFDVGEKEAAAKAFTFNNDPFKLVTEYSQEEKERTSWFTISTCKDNSLDDDLTNSLYDPGLAQRTELEGSMYQITIPNVPANCGMDAEKVSVDYDYKINVVNKTMTLIIDLQDSSPQANCICNYDMSFKVPNEYARNASFVSLLGTTYRFEGVPVDTTVADTTSRDTVKAPAFIPTEKTAGLTLMETNQYGIGKGECKENKSEYEKIHEEMDRDYELPTAYLISDGKRYQILFKDVEDYCDVDGEISMEFDYNWVGISYSNDAIVSKCTCTYDHYFDIDPNIAPKIYDASFKGKRYDVVR